MILPERQMILCQKLDELVHAIHALSDGFHRHGGIIPRLLTAS